MAHLRFSFDVPYIVTWTPVMGILGHFEMYQGFKKTNRLKMSIWDILEITFVL